MKGPLHPASITPCLYMRNLSFVCRRYSLEGADLTLWVLEVSSRGVTIRIDANMDIMKRGRGDLQL